MMVKSAVYFCFTEHPFFQFIGLTYVVIKHAKNNGEVKIWRLDLVLKF